MARSSRRPSHVWDDQIQAWVPTSEAPTYTNTNATASAAATAEYERLRATEAAEDVARLARRLAAGGYWDSGTVSCAGATPEHWEAFRVLSEIERSDIKVEIARLCARHGLTPPAEPEPEPEPVRVTAVDGPMKNFSGELLSRANGIARVSFLVFGNEKEVEVDEDDLRLAVPRGEESTIRATKPLPKI